MKTFIVISCFVCSLCFVQSETDTGYKFFPKTRGWLTFYEMPVTWSEARLRCQLEGAVLASPIDSFMKDAMTSLMNDNNVQCASFTGISSIFARGIFSSIEGVPLSQIPHIWTKAEPDNLNGEENCILMRPDGSLADANCEETFSYMCYRRYNPLYEKVINDCNTIDPEYKYYKNIGSCYKLHKVASNWTIAYMTCLAEGAYLAILNDEQEARVVTDLYLSIPTGQLIGSKHHDYIFIGFHNWNLLGDWRTIHGHTLADAGFDRFHSGDPDNIGESCGALKRSGLLVDLWCYQSYNFVCEKKTKKTIGLD